MVSKFVDGCAANTVMCALNLCSSCKTQQAHHTQGIGFSSSQEGKLRALPTVR